MKQWMIDLIVVISISAIVWGVLWAKLPETKYVEVEQIVEVEVIREVPVVKYVFLGSGYDFTYSDNETMSAYEALLWIDGGIRSHQYYIDNPELQNKGTGDTAFQERTKAQYLRARSLIERILNQKEITDGQRANTGTD